MILEVQKFSFSKISAFSKIPTKRTFVHLLFLMLNQSRNTKKKFEGGFFFKKLKKHFFWGPKQQFLKLKFQICFSAFVFLCKRKLHADFHKKILIFRLILIRTSKIIPDLWLSTVFCLIKKINITPPYCQRASLKVHFRFLQYYHTK